jgi:hypothetical protein
VEDRVAGFGRQPVIALDPRMRQPEPRLYHGPELAQFQDLREQLETKWTDMLRERVGLARNRLPLLWDCDFMFGDRAAGAPERYVLCEINVSSVAPFPPEAIGPLVQAVQSHLRTAS